MKRMEKKNKDISRKILLSGFEPFGEYGFNTSIEAVRPFDGRQINGYRVKVIQTPVVWGEPEIVLFDEIKKYAPDIVIASGMGQQAISIERTARNTTTRMQDNRKKMPPEHGKVILGGPETLPTGLPAEKLLDALKAGGINAVISEDAGGFLCNWLFYNLMRRLGSGSGITAGFIHFPVTKPDAPEFKNLFRAWEIILETITKY
jgi:pyroglutamyl-peptidase